MLDYSEQDKENLSVFFLKLHSYGFYDNLVFNTHSKDNILYLGAEFVRSLNFRYLVVEFSLVMFTNEMVAIKVSDKFSKLFVKNIKSTPNIYFDEKDVTKNVNISFDCYKLENENKIEEKFYLKNVTLLSITGKGA